MNRIITKSTGKIISLFCILAVCMCHANAQDTVRFGEDSIYMVPPVVKDTIPFWIYWTYPSGAAKDGYSHYTDECNENYHAELIGEVYVADDSTLIYGVALQVESIQVVSRATLQLLYEGWENGTRDSALWAIIVRKTHSDDRILYERVDSVLWHPHAASRTMLYPIYSSPDDTMWLPTPMYELYFDHPLMMKDTFYVCTRPTYGWELDSNNSRPCRLDGICYTRYAKTVNIPPYPLGLQFWRTIEQRYEYLEGENVPLGERFPILVPPDTDDVPQCMAPANFRKSGQRMEYPILAWDTTEGGQREYEIQYAPYNSDRWITFEPTENPATVFPASNPDIYYKARIHARCYHGCVVHNIWSWSPWSEEILFYTGPTEPDTTTAITPVEGCPDGLFTLSPNPATGTVTVSCSTGSILAPAHSSPKLGEVPVRAEECVKSFTITLTDAAGREVMRKEFSIVNCQFSIPLDLSHLAAGTYFVTLSTPTATGTQRLVVR